MSATGIYFFAQDESGTDGYRVLAIVAEGFDYGELSSVNRTLAREGFVVTTASFTTERISKQGSHLSVFEPDIAFDDVDVLSYDVVFIPGGQGPENIINHPDRQVVYDILAQAYNEEKIIAAICHGPWVLAAANIVSGKNVTCYNDQDMVTDLMDSGAWVDVSRNVIRDGNIITANGPQAAGLLAEEIISALVEDA